MTVQYAGTMSGCLVPNSLRPTPCSEADGAVAPPPPTAEGTVVVGSLANSYATYQLRLSARLAREHHALRWAAGCGHVNVFLCGRPGVRTFGWAGQPSSRHAGTERTVWSEIEQNARVQPPVQTCPPAFQMPLRRNTCSDAVAIEVLARQLAAQGAGPDALLSLCPWLEFITIPTQVGFVCLG